MMSLKFSDIYQLLNTKIDGAVLSNIGLETYEKRIGALRGYWREKIEIAFDHLQSIIMFSLAVTVV